MQWIRHHLRQALLLVLLWPLHGCDQYSAVKGGLGPEDVARFERGQRVATPCWTCHDLVGGSHKVGPALRGLFGRQAGTMEGYPYSEALLATDLVWSARSLDAFLRDGQALIPGNRMVSPGVPGDGARADLIFFLELVTARR